jgi:hypothetical protein
MSKTEDAVLVPRAAEETRTVITLTPETAPISTVTVYTENVAEVSRANMCLTRIMLSRLTRACWTAQILRQIELDPQIPAGGILEVVLPNMPVNLDKDSVR